MGIYKYLNHTPQIGKECFIADTASVVGRVTLGDNVSIWYGSVLRGDIDDIEVGENTNIQDLSTLHITEGHPLKIGKNVTVGHNAVLHSCTIKNNVLVGMGAIILDDAVIGENSLVAAGSVVPPGKTYPKNSLIMGAPAKVVKEFTEEERGGFVNQYKAYLKIKTDYLDPDKLEKIRE